METLLGRIAGAIGILALMKLLIPLAACALALGTSSVASAAETLQNDGFAAGMAVGYQGGFIAGEAAAVELTPSAGNWRLDSVRFLYGTNATTRTVRVTIYQGSASPTPGAEIYADDYSVTGSADALIEIDLIAQGIIVNSAFRVGIAFNDAGNPSIARDDDGSNTAGKNFFFVDLLGSGSNSWQSTNILLAGDWVIRAVVTEQGGGGTPDAGPGDPDASPSNAPDAAPSADNPDAGASVSCTLNSDCALGSYCGDDSICAIDCRNDIDCSNDMSCEPALGRCEASASDEGGCGCSSSSPLGGLSSGLFLLALIALRRRRQA